MSADLPTDDVESGRLLGLLGERVRTLRTHRRMTRKTLAEVSQVSERYLAHAAVKSNTPAVPTSRPTGIFSVVQRPSPKRHPPSRC